VTSCDGDASVGGCCRECGPRSPRREKPDEVSSGKNPSSPGSRQSEGQAQGGSRHPLGVKPCRARTWHDQTSPSPAMPPFGTRSSSSFWRMAVRLGVISGDDAMGYFAFRTVFAAMLGLSFVATSYSEAPAQQRATCSQARSSCGKQPVCQRRYEACMETGCWTVGLVKRCGYEKE
jgi:hypothetical protein